MNPISLPFLFNAIKNNIGKAILTFLLTMVLVALAIIYLPREYRSEAIIFVRLGRESVSLDPTATTGSTVSVLESRDNEVNSIRDMLTSRALLESVVDRMGPDVVLGDADIPDELITEHEPVEDDFEKSPRQKAIKLLQEKLYVISTRKSSVLKVGVEVASPQLARRVLQVYLDSYKAMHTAAHQTPDSNEFFAEQAEFLQQQWKTSMNQLQQTKKEAGVVSIEGAQENLKEQFNETQSQLMEVQSQRDATLARLKELETVAAQPLKARKVSDELIKTRADLAAMDAELTTLRNQMQQLLDKSAELNLAEVKIKELEQEVAVSETNYSQYRELREQTRIEEALHSSKFTNVKVVQQPSFIPKAVSPKKAILAAAGLVAGMSGAFLIAILWEFWKLRPGSRPPETRSVESTNPSGLQGPEPLIQNANA